MAVAAKAAHAEEQVSRRDLATVVREARDLHAGRLAGGLGGDQRVESHGLMLLKAQEPTEAMRRAYPGAMPRYGSAKLMICPNAGAAT